MRLPDLSQLFHYNKVVNNVAGLLGLTNELIAHLGKGDVGSGRDSGMGWERNGCATTALERKAIRRIR